ncbi:MAG: YgjV family protein [Clostridia bacterium]|nr:YgjV family protein [Clostridia bacterium]
MNFVIQGIGIGGMILCFLCFWGKKHNNVLLIKLAADVLWAIHYFMLGALSGGMVNVICCIRECIYLLDKNEKRRYIWLLFFVVINWISAIFTWKGIQSLLPTIVTTFGAYSFWQKNVKVTRVLGVTNGIMMFTYDIFAKSYIGMVSESLSIISAGITLIKFRKQE